MKTYDVYLVRIPGGGRLIPGTTRRADASSWVAVERGPLDPRVAPDHATQVHGPVLAAGKAEAVALVRDRGHRKLIPWRPL